jgi:hypothetical protein
MAALEAGEHFMVIKPLALFKKGTEALRQKAKERGLVLAMGYDRCFHPASDELRKFVAVGKLGKIVHAEGNFCIDCHRGLPEGDWKRSDENSQPSSLTDHMLYRMIKLLGPLESLTVQAARHVATADISDTAAISPAGSAAVSRLLASRRHFIGYICSVPKAGQKSAMTASLSSSRSRAMAQSSSFRFSTRYTRSLRALPPPLTTSAPIRYRPRMRWPVWRHWKPWAARQNPAKPRLSRPNEYGFSFDFAV